MNVTWPAPSPNARGAMSSRACLRLGIVAIDPGLVAEPEPPERLELDEQVAQRPGDDADRQAGHPEGRGQEQRPADDRQVVDARRDRRRGEPPAGVEHAGRHGPHRQEDRAEQHDPGEDDRLLELLALEARRDHAHDRRRQHEQDRRQRRQPDQHQVDHRRHDAPGVRLVVAFEEARHDRDQGRRQRARGDQLEDQVGDAEGGEERVELRRIEQLREHDQADPAQDARDEEGPRHDQAGPGEPAGGGHGAATRRALGCASR